MAIISGTYVVQVFKFRSTGVVALCEEVASLAADGSLENMGVIIDTARFVEDDNSFVIEFDRER